VRRGRILVAAVQNKRTRVFGRGVWPAWSPNGSLIAYLWKRAVWVGHVDGTHKRRVLAPPTGSGSWGAPSWLGGSREIYVPSGEGPSGVIVRSDGSNRHPLEVIHEPPVVTSEPAPDGRSLAYEWGSAGPSGYQYNRISIVPIAGGDAATVVETLDKFAARSSRRLAWQPRLGGRGS
jgi:hypothetical protein